MIIDRLWDIFTGITATLLVITFIYATGFALVPIRCIRAKDSDSMTRAGVWGAVFVILWCWYGLLLRVPFPLSIRVLAIIVLATILIRRKEIFNESECKFIRTRVPLFILMYSIFYTISYTSLAPPVSDSYLPITRIYNNDIFNYFILGKYVQDPGTPNIANFSFIDAPSLMLQFTPAILTLINVVAMAFRNDTLTAAMPVIFATSALIGCSIVFLARAAFNLSWRYATCIGAVSVSGTFFHYIVGSYFLSSLLAIFFILLLLRESIRFVRIEHKSGSLEFVSCFSALYIAIFYCYPPLFIVASGLQVGFGVIYLVLNRKIIPLELLKDNDRISKLLFQWGVGLASCFAIVAAVDPNHAIQMFRLLVLIQSKGDLGWTLDLISPMGIYGFPSPLILHGPLLHLIAIGISVLVLALLIRAYLRRTKQLTSVAGLSLFLLSTLSLLSYFAYFLHSGSTYQQWKIASYLPLPLSFAFFGAIGELAREKDMRTPVSSHVALVVISTIIVLYNTTTDIRQGWRNKGFSSNYKNLAAIDMVGGPKDLYIKMSTFSSTFFAVYFVNSKRLHLLSPSYYPQEDFDIRTASLSRQLFLEGGDCQANEGNITIRGVGCLYLTPPYLEFARQYNFNATIPGLISASGLSGAETWGTWSNAKNVELNMLLDPSSARGAGVHYINLLLRPSISEKIKSQGIQASSGGHAFKEYELTREEWVSVPYTNSDLRGVGNRELAVSMVLPNALIPHDADVKNPEMRLLGVGFISLLLSDKPIGHVLTP
jgi:hypothetical protein